MKILLSCVVLVAVAACGGGKTEDAKDPSGKKPTTEASAGGGDEKKVVEAMGEAFIAACEGKAAGDACDAVFKDGEVEKPFTGKCVQPPAESKEQRVVCLPNDLE